MDASQCPSCGSRKTQVAERISASVVAAGYAAPSLGVDVSDQLANGQDEWLLTDCGDCGLRWYAQAPAGDGRFYESLLRHSWYYQSEKSEYGFAARHVQAGDRVLEVGCGRGVFRGQLPDSLTYRGLEFNLEALRLAREAGLDVVLKPVEDEASEQPGGYDVVCHFQVLEHVEDPAGFMAACARALRPGGRLIVAVPAEDSFIGLAESSWLNMPPHHLSRWPDRALAKAFERVGVTPTEFWHEPVAEIHRQWHAGVLAQAGWLSLWGGQPSTVGRARASLPARIAKRLPGAGAWLQARALARWPQASHGHTVCLVGVKQGSA